VGRINFAWLAVWVLIPDWLCRKLGVCQFLGRLDEGAASGGKAGDATVPEFASYTLAFALQLRKIAENPSQGSRKALGSTERTCCFHYIGGYGRCRADVYERFRYNLEECPEKLILT
jgi:hypothetical protein